MKNTILLIAIAFIFQSCVRENTSTDDLMEMQEQNSTLLYSGVFEKGPYGNNINGKAEIYEKNGTYTLVFSSDFTVSNGPDLYVYVSKEQQPSSFISLGKLKSVNGGQVYTFNNMPDISTYKYAVVHCQQYNHLFAYSLLQKK